jgi:hypothetical protein
MSVGITLRDTVADDDVDIERVSIGRTIRPIMIGSA